MTQIKGIAASRGIGTGHVCIVTEHEFKYAAKRTDDTASEKMRLNLALEKFKKNTTKIAADFKKKLGSREAEILDGHLLIISDPVMKDEMYKRIASGQCAEAAVEAVCDMFIEKFSKLEDDMMRQRAYDISDIKVRILKILLGIEEISISDVAPGTVIVAKELTPSMISQINKENIAGIVAETGTETSHSAILAEALEIPTVLSVKSALKLMKNNDTVIVDGKDGLVYIEPDEDVLSEYAKKREAFMQRESELKKFSYAKTITADGTRLNLFCNIGTPDQAQKAAECGCEGIGLFRSEFLFINNSRMPGEEEQLAAYKKAVQIMAGKPVIIRTLDVGADKAVPYLNIQKEENPFLGYRAVRYCLGNKESYIIQLRAIMRASAFGKVKIMLPLVTCVDELRAVKELVADIKKDFDSENIAYDKNIEVGCMIETPAASLIADILAKEADFFSIGTNDLTQYTMSADRGNSDVAYLYSAFQPSVLRSIRHIIECGRSAGIPVGMCGEAAADPLMIPLLISFGLTEFSVNPVLVLTARCIISKWSKSDADALTDKVMSLSTESEIVAALKEASKE